MKKLWFFFSAILTLTIMVGLVGTLIYSAYTSTPIGELIDWDWWALFLIAEIWIAHRLMIHTKDFKEIEK